jgi:prepilin-type N-terminal cleavage/methylation domain-containing protein
MTKMKESRRGFTLVEIVVVVAIIVIVAAAAFLGVAVTVKRATDSRNQLVQHNGDNFEVDARNEIEHLKADPNFTPIQQYDPDGEIEDDEDDEDGEDEVVEENGGSGGPHSTTNTPTPTATPTPTKAPASNTNTPTPTPTNTPTPTPTNTPTPTKVPDNNSYTPSYGNAGRPSSGTTTYASNGTSSASGTSSNITQKGDQWNACRIEANIPNGTNTVVFYVKGAGSSYEFKSYNGTVTNLGDGYYRVTFYNDNTQSIQIYSEGNGGFKGATEACIVEYTTTK